MGFCKDCEFYDGYCCDVHDLWIRNKIPTFEDENKMSCEFHEYGRYRFYN